MQSLMPVVYGLLIHGGGVAEPTAFDGRIHRFSMAEINNGGNYRPLP